MRYMNEELTEGEDRKHQSPSGYQEEEKIHFHEKSSWNSIEYPKGYHHEQSSGYPKGYDQEQNSVYPKGYDHEQNSGYKNEDSPHPIGYKDEEHSSIETNHQDYIYSADSQVHPPTNDPPYYDVFYVDEEEAAKHLLENDQEPPQTTFSDLWKVLHEFAENESIEDLKNEDKDRSGNDKFDNEWEKGRTTEKNKRNKGKSSVS